MALLLTKTHHQISNNEGEPTSEDRLEWRKVCLLVAFLSISGISFFEGV